MHWYGYSIEVVKRKPNASPFSFFGCRLQGYMSRTVRPSVSYNSTIRTIPHNHWSEQRRNQSNKFENKSILQERVRQRRKSHSGVVLSMVYKVRWNMHHEESSQCRKVRERKQLNQPGLGETAWDGQKQHAKEKRRPQSPLGCSSGGCSEAPPDHIAKFVEKEGESSDSERWISLVEVSRHASKSGSGSRRFHSHFGSSVFRFPRSWWE